MVGWTSERERERVHDQFFENSLLYFYYYYFLDNNTYLLTRWDSLAWLNDQDDDNEKCFVNKDNNNKNKTK